MEFHEDCLLNMFMATLEEKSILWYEGLPPTSLYSLKDFYSAFYENYKEDHPSIELIESFCGNFESLVLYPGIDMDDEDLMNHEIKEALLEFNYQSSCSSDMSVFEPWLQREHVQETVFLDASKGQGYTEDELVEE